MHIIRFRSSYDVLSLDLDRMDIITNFHQSLWRGVYHDSLDYDRHRRNIQSGISLNPLRHLQGRGDILQGTVEQRTVRRLSLYLVLDEVVRPIPIAIRYS